MYGGIVLSITVLAILLTLLSGHLRYKIRDMRSDESGAIKIGGIILGKKAIGYLIGAGVTGALVYEGGRRILVDDNGTYDNGGSAEGFEKLEAMLEMIMDVLPWVFVAFLGIFGLMMVVQLLRAFSN